MFNSITVNLIGEGVQSGLCLWLLGRQPHPHEGAHPRLPHDGEQQQEDPGQPQVQERLQVTKVKIR